ncbi:hypothetical protein BCU33_009765 [Vibrio lentus]|uniref:hypothetical protein n=1 Tax=Vibrio lentus TaxID=136468 RepID=UPI000C85F663|nr:hypothetical protein [Vibrio lentus]PMI91943.1 hypothetical protein BCU33_10075 [Vibrio lentus]
MFVTRVISYLDGWDILKSQKAHALDDICTVLTQLTPKNLSHPKIKPYSRHTEGVNPITPFSFMHATDYFLKELQWNDYRVRPTEKGGFHLYARNLKDGVSVRAMATDRMQSFPNWLFVEVPKLYESGATQVSVLLIPEEDVKSILDPERGLGPTFTLPRCGVLLKDLSPLKMSSPFVVIGFSMQENLFEIEVDHIEPDESSVFIDRNVIEKSIEFPPEHYQAGIGILSYFGDVLKAKHPDTKAKIRIEQGDGVVRLHIHTPNGNKEIIEKTLADYTLVVAEKAPPESLFEDKVQIMALENKLEIAKMEVRQTQNMLMLTQNSSHERVRSLEEEVSFMRNQLGIQLSHIEDQRVLTSTVVACNEKLVLCQTTSNEKMIDSLIEKAWSSRSVIESLEYIKGKLEGDLTDDDEDDIKKSISVIQENDPDLLLELRELLRNTVYGVSGNTVFQWLQSMSLMSP